MSGIGGNNHDWPFLFLLELSPVEGPAFFGLALGLEHVFTHDSVGELKVAAILSRGTPPVLLELGIFL